MGGGSGSLFQRILHLSANKEDNAGGNGGVAYAPLGPAKAGRQPEDRPEEREPFLDQSCSGIKR